MRIASTTARFGQPEVNLGIIPGYGGTQRLIELVGKGKAIELLTTGDMIKAEEARNLGLVNDVVEADELNARCKEIISKILSKGPLAIGKVVECVNAHFRAGVDGYTTEIELFGDCFDTEDFKEGTQAFVEKRMAEFKGR